VIPNPTARDELARVEANEPVAEGLFRLVLRLPPDWGPPQPGQFVQLALPERSPWRLRRPFSVAGWEAHSGGARLEILYAPVGEQTRRLASGRYQELGVLGPLGAGFRPPERPLAVLVGGGRGIAPLLFLARRLGAEGKEPLLLYGAKTASQLWSLPRGGRIREATEDGSRGLRGTVLDLLEELGAEARSAEVLACGPLPMLRAVVAWAARRGIPTQVSVETHFGCGVGICAGCAVPLRGRRGFERFALACRQGPVFRGEEVDWDALPEA
jgi:dihydroorotate dehydrogenase electron transfer subunit